jgi:hypothetical protein
MGADDWQPSHRMWCTRQGSRWNHKYLAKRYTRQSDDFVKDSIENRKSCQIVVPTSQSNDLLKTLAKKEK